MFLQVNRNPAIVSTNPLDAHGVFLYATSLDVQFLQEIDAWVGCLLEEYKACFQYCAHMMQDIEYFWFQKGWRLELTDNLDTTLFNDCFHCVVLTHGVWHNGAASSLGGIYNRYCGCCP